MDSRSIDLAGEGIGKIHKIDFNQSNDCFIVTSNLGFSIYKCDPCRLISFRCIFIYS